MTQPNFVAGYIVNRNASKEPLYLLLKRSQHSHFPGIWQMVTGKLNEGESPNIAVKREILEETGLTCSEIYNVDVTMFYEQYKNRIAFSANYCAFTDDSDSVILSETEHEAYRWCTFSEATELLAFPSQKQTLAFIHEFFVIQKANHFNLIN